jgi:hypothetical protein
VGYEVRKGQTKAHQIPERRTAKVRVCVPKATENRNDFHPGHRAGNERNRREHEGRAMARVVAASNRRHGIADDEACEEERLACELHEQALPDSLETLR